MKRNLLAVYVASTLAGIGGISSAALLRLRPACLWAKMNSLSTKHLR